MLNGTRAPDNRISTDLDIAQLLVKDARYRPNDIPNIADSIVGAAQRGDISFSAATYLLRALIEVACGE